MGGCEGVAFLPIIYRGGLFLGPRCGLVKDLVSKLLGELGSGVGLVSSGCKLIWC